MCSPALSPPLHTPHFEGCFYWKKNKDKPFNPLHRKGLSDLSLLCHKGTPSPLLPCKTAWTSRRYPVCWGTTTRDSPSAPTPTPPGRCRIKRRKPWAASWHKSCKGTPAVAKTPGRKATPCPVLFNPGGLRNKRTPPKIYAAESKNNAIFSGYHGQLHNAGDVMAAQQHKKHRAGRPNFLSGAL